MYLSYVKSFQYEQLMQEQSFAKDFKKVNVWNLSRKIGNRTSQKGSTTGM